MPAVVQRPKPQGLLLLLILAGENHPQERSGVCMQSSLLFIHNIFNDLDNLAQVDNCITRERRRPLRQEVMRQGSRLLVRRSRLRLYVVTVEVMSVLRPRLAGEAHPLKHPEPRSRSSR
jgi:hypothetical protein